MPADRFRLPELFSAVPTAPDDPIMSVAEAFRADPRPEKANLSVGMYLDESGRVPLMRSVEEAQRRILARGDAHGYGPMTGSDAYRRAVKGLVFGEGDADDGAIVTVQTLGGTGALRLGCAFLKETLGLTDGAASNPTWGNHVSILKLAGLTPHRYRWTVTDKGTPDEAGVFEDLKTLPEGTVVILHACCHNPTGSDLSPSRFEALFDLLEERRLIPFVDMAYQGFGEGLDEDARMIRELRARGLPFLAATSSSKNFGLYGERVGALHVVTGSADEARRVESVLKVLVRSSYSNPPAWGGAIVAEILNDADLRSLWVSEVEAARSRILAMRRALGGEGKRLGADLSFAVRQKGMFSMTGLTPDQMTRLREAFAVYGVANGRICMAGLNRGNVKRVAEALARVMKS